MLGLAGPIALAALSGTLLIHYLKNFFLAEKTKFSPDWDGWLERGAVTFCVIQGWWLLIIPIVILKAVYRLLFIDRIEGTNEPGAVSQKVKFKGELAFDLLASPALAILIGLVF